MSPLPRAPSGRGHGPRSGRPLLALALTLALAFAIAGALASCAKKGPPSGGPPDIEPPRLLSSAPDSGASGVPRDARLSLTFSEGMEPRSTGESVSLAPWVEFRQQRWSGRTVTLVPAKLLDRDRTYTLFVGGQARDRHGNPLGSGATVVFSTADSFPPGAIEGKLEARGFSARGTFLWCYDVSRGHVPDSTARDFDALALADADGVFRVAGLTVPGRYRLWAFADLDGNRSYEPARDILFPADTTFDLDAARPRAVGIDLVVVNPRAPGRLRGAVLDTLEDSLGVVRVLAVADSDTTVRKLAELGERGGFDLDLEPGQWRIRAFRDLDRNRTWKPGEEPASDLLRIRVEAADDIHDLVLVLRRPSGVP
jgi:hypothetical protein